jgi:hypothetical protein
LVQRLVHGGEVWSADTYANGLREDLTWRQQWVQRTGLGFNLVGSIGVNVIELKVAVNA